MKESTLVANIHKRLKELKASGLPLEWRKVHGSGYQRRGEPDFDIVLDGQSHKIEVKIDGKSPTNLQRKRLDDWRKAGAMTGVAYSVKDVEGFLGL